jgi:hypothetical protein
VGDQPKNAYANSCTNQTNDYAISEIRCFKPDIRPSQLNFMENLSATRPFLFFNLPMLILASVGSG